jgi:excisionase family DNA binding protein
VSDDRDDEILTAREVARLFRVDPKTVSRWERTGRLRAFKTPGGHRRFRRGDVERAISEARVRDDDRSQSAR